MNSKHFAVKISVMAALIFTVVGLSGYATSAKHTPETAPPASSRLDVIAMSRLSTIPSRHMRAHELSITSP